MGKKNRQKLRRYPYTAQPANYKPVSAKKGLSNAKKMFIGLILIAVIVIAASFTFSSQSPPQQPTQGNSYPTNVAPVTFASPRISTDSNQVSVPVSNVNSSKLLFVDLKLTSPLQTLEYQGRTIPLSYYRDGQYLPLVVISAPSGNTIAGIRTCEPCGSFSFHIVRGANLKCDVCGTEWTLEDFTPISGGCTTYPPPKLSTTINGDNVQVDLSALDLQYNA